MSALFGILMVLSAAVTGSALVLGLLGLALVAVGVALADRRAATVAVLLTVVALALSDPAPMFAAASGLSAAVYLVTRETALTVPTVAGLIGFTAAGVAATAMALPVSWIPLLAPAVIAGVLIVAARPLLGDDSTGDLPAPWSEGRPSDSVRMTDA